MVLRFPISPTLRQTFGRLPIALLLLAVAPGLSACGEDEADEPPVPRPPPREVVPLVAPRITATARAFDLVASGEGAALVYGPPGPDGGGIRLLSLTALGDIRGSERTVVARRPGDDRPLAHTVIELAAASGGGRLGVVWVEHAEPDRIVYATHGPLTADAFSPPELLTRLGRRAIPWGSMRRSRRSRPRPRWPIQPRAGTAHPHPGTLPPGCHRARPPPPPSPRGSLAAQAAS
ncbi:MAG: hypothetical protein AAGF12_42575, partial [Myxococcota bacterium]